MSLLLAPLREVSLNRHNRAVAALKNSTLVVTFTLKSEAEIRALVKNGEGTLYHVNLTEQGAYCSCPDALHRHTICKHIVVTCVKCLQNTHASAPPIHLWWHDGTAALCGEKAPKRFWIRWTYNALNWPDVCQACVQVWQNPLSKDEFYYQQAK